MTEKKTILDLDELFGRARAVKVKWQGVEYELLRMDGISPKQAVQFQKLQARVSRLTVDGGRSTESDDAQAAVELENALDEMLTLLCDELPIADIPFGMKMRIIEFYGEETQVKKKAKAALPATGETPSAD